MAKKQKIIEQINHEIYNRAFLPGDRFYSVRDLGKKFNCSHMTAYNVLSEFEENEIIFAKERSGYFLTEQIEVLTQYGLIQNRLSEPNFINLVPHLIKTESIKEMIPLGTAARFSSLLPIKKVMSLRAKTNDFFQENYSTYSYPPGDIGLRSSLAKRLRLRKISTVADDIVLTSGALESIYLSLRMLTSPGDKVVISAPIFFGIVQVLDQLGLRVIEVPILEGNKIDLPAIRSVVKQDPDIKAGIFQVNYSNPTGMTLKENEKKELVKVFEENNRYLIEDDTYGDLCHDGKIRTCLKSFDKKNRVVFSCSSFSKTLGPGFRVGWVLPPEQYKEKLTRYKLAMNFSTSASSEKIIAEFLGKKDQYADHLSALNNSFKQNMQKIEETLTREIVVPHKMIRPDGGFCLWIELPHQFDTFVLYKNLIKKNIAISPGQVFSTQNKYRNCFRINAAMEFTKEVVKALKIIANEINKY